MLLLDITEMVTDECSIPYEEKEDCGHYGIKKEECLEQGCCWVPSKRPNDPWCFSAKPGAISFQLIQVLPVVADLGKGRTSLPEPKFLHVHSFFWEKIGQIVGWRPLRARLL